MANHALQENCAAIQGYVHTYVYIHLFLGVPSYYLKTVVPRYLVLPILRIENSQGVVYESKRENPPPEMFMINGKNLIRITFLLAELNKTSLLYKREGIFKCFEYAKFVTVIIFL